MSRVTIGVGGPVGSGKTALLDSLCKRLRDRYSLAVITNDIYTYEDAEFLMRSGALPLERIRGVQTGGCPHTAIREDTSINHEAIEETIARFPDVRIVEDGGDRGNDLRMDFDEQLLRLRRADRHAADRGGERAARQALGIAVEHRFDRDAEVSRHRANHHRMM